MGQHRTLHSPTCTCHVVNVACFFNLIQQSSTNTTNTTADLKKEKTKDKGRESVPGDRQSESKLLLAGSHIRQQRTPSSLDYKYSLSAISTRRHPYTYTGIIECVKATTASNRRKHHPRWHTMEGEDRMCPNTLRT